ncbi:plasmid transfer protein TraA [Actinacidiphila acididurans]|uniref:Sporulation protein SsgA n=1 Tax=Actinacidiphila acididurans TaxID=2784346 RepID=A0ABS2U2Z0_9ACTN|nr:plasmid transfer protein TraA [Actinacidiphila acididurans]MBM9509958.1 hypothetical protein [Actinacidiphila acididurans]
MAAPDYDLHPSGPGPRRLAPAAPPRPTAPPTPPTPPAAAGPSPTARARHERRGKTVNKTRNGGGFNPSFNPGVNITVVKQSGGSGGNGAGQGGTTAGPSGTGSSGTPGSAFMSNEDIRTFAEHVRRGARARATERAMDAEQLEEVLRHIPDLNGSIGGARMRARRVSKHLKRIAKAEQVIAKEAAAAYASFEREYDSNARTVSKGRTPPPPRAKFSFN